jgi:hypothetical protein
MTGPSPASAPPGARWTSVGTFPWPSTFPR